MYRHLSPAFKHLYLSARHLSIVYRWMQWLKYCWYRCLIGPVTNCSSLATPLVGSLCGAPNLVCSQQLCVTVRGTVSSSLLGSRVTVLACATCRAVSCSDNSILSGGAQAEQILRQSSLGYYSNSAGA